MSDLTPESLAELRALRADLLPWLIGSSADQAPCDRGELRTILDPLPALLDAAAERDALAAAVERVRELHKPEGIHRFCSMCAYRPWPCPTIRALDESETDR